MDLGLKGKRVAVTGGSKGIGEAVVRRFVEEGCKVVFSGRSTADGEVIAKYLGDNAEFVTVDIGIAEKMPKRPKARFSVSGWSGGSTRLLGLGRTR